jgi:hypothetical protein
MIRGLFLAAALLIAAAAGAVEPSVGSPIRRSRRAPVR